MGWTCRVSCQNILVTTMFCSRKTTNPTWNLSIALIPLRAVLSLDNMVALLLLFKLSMKINSYELTRFDSITVPTQIINHLIIKSRSSDDDDVDKYKKCNVVLIFWLLSRSSIKINSGGFSFSISTWMEYILATTLGYVDLLTRHFVRISCRSCDKLIAGFVDSFVEEIKLPNWTTNAIKTSPS